MAGERNQRDNPGVIAPPPLIYLGFLVIGLLLDYVWPAGVAPDGVRYPSGIALFALGGAIFAFALRQLRKAGTSLEPRKPTTAVVTGGPYRLSRNPIYVALSLAYLGLAVAADSPWAAALLVPALAVMHYGVIAREERYLEGKFGDEYLRYKASVRRWL